MTQTKWPPTNPGRFIFLLLIGALGSARDALLVFSAVPLALTGGAVALWLRGMPFSVSAAVGFIALSGIAVLNGLVMLSLITQLMRQGRRMPREKESLAIVAPSPIPLLCAFDSSWCGFGS